MSFEIFTAVCLYGVFIFVPIGMLMDGLEFYFIGKVCGIISSLGLIGGVVGIGILGFPKLIELL